MQPLAQGPYKRASRRLEIPFAGAVLAAIVDEPAELADAPVVLFSHCFTCNKDLKAIVRISRRLAEWGFTVVRFDMTGLGGSTGDFSATNFSTNLADLRAVATYAATHLRPATALIGHSFGGAASMAIAAEAEPVERADRSLAELRAVVTLAAPADTQHLATLLLHMNPAIEEAGEGEVTIGGFRWRITEQMIEDFRRHRLADAITRLTLPLLVVHSPADHMVHFDQALRIMQLASSGDTPAAVSLLTLDGADHLFNNQPADLIYLPDAIACFLARYAAGPRRSS